MKNRIILLLITMLPAFVVHAQNKPKTSQEFQTWFGERNTTLNRYFDSKQYDALLKSLDTVVAVYHKLEPAAQKEMNLDPQLTYFYALIHSKRNDAKATLCYLKKAEPYGEKLFKQFMPQILTVFKDDRQFAPYCLKLHGKQRIPLLNIRVDPEYIEEPGSEVAKIADEQTSGDNAIFHTEWGGMTKQTITITANLDGKGRRLDRIVVSPRASGNNGIIKEAELWIMVKGYYQLVEKINARLSNRPLVIDLKQSIKDPQKIKLVILDSYGDRNNGHYLVSLGELECQTLANPEKNNELNSYNDLFENCGQALRKEVTLTQIQAIKIPEIRKLAEELYQKSYSSKDRAALYKPYLHPVELAHKMHMGEGFSKMEGISGMYLNAGDNYLFVNGAGKEELLLLVPDFLRKTAPGIKPDRDPEGWGLQMQEFKLHDGLNCITLTKPGNAYVQYFTDTDPKDCPDAAVHFVTGQVNRFFDLTRGDTNADFDRLLSGAVSPVLDLRGKYIQLAFPTDSLRKYASGKGLELVQCYDSIVGMEKRLMGWEKEGIRFDNHILGRVNYQYFMFRDDNGMAFVDWAMNKVCIPQKVFTNESWGICHEMGHVFQMIPQMTWPGMTEVSNNILTMYCNDILSNKSRLSGEKRYEAARKNILDKGISYLAFPGKNNGSANVYGEDGKSTNVFERLVPFWQLYLYFKSKGYTDFYPDLMIALRHQEPLGTKESGKLYLNMLEFCRQACIVSHTDLTEFFERWGFFYVGEINVVDYSRVTYQVTQAEIDALKAGIARMNLPKPTVDITTLED